MASSLSHTHKVARRKKRQAKKALQKSLAIQKLAFLWKEFLGIKDVDKTYYPSKDPTVTNHRRVIGQRILSGRVKPSVPKGHDNNGVVPNVGV